MTVSVLNCKIMNPTGARMLRNGRVTLSVCDSTACSAGDGLNCKKTHGQPLQITGGNYFSCSNNSKLSTRLTFGSSAIDTSICYVAIKLTALPEAKPLPAIVLRRELVLT